MSYTLVKRNKIAVKVKGTLPDEDGKPVRFDFKLHCTRMGQDEIDAAREENAKVKPFIRRVAEGWDGVLDRAGQPVEFSDEGLDEIIDQAGMPMLIMRCYLEQVAATAKN